MDQKLSPKDVLLQIWTIASLYISAGGLITLLFQYINYWLPDAANPSYGLSDSVRWAIALLVTIFPSYIVASVMLQRGFLNIPQKREGVLRKWLLYFTLFIAAIALVGDLSVLVYNFLGGELSLRFFLKVLAVGIVAGGVFWYYLWDLRRQEIAILASPLLFLRIGIGLIFIAIAGGFFIAGSPFTQRLAKIDLQRVSDLEQIQSQIVYGYWQPKQKLPAALGDLRNEISGFVVPVDPETGMPYEYRITGPLSFELCATFSAKSTAVSPERMAPSPVSYPAGVKVMDLQTEPWDHDAGRTCFSRTIDPELFKEKPLYR